MGIDESNESDSQPRFYKGFNLEVRVKPEKSVAAPERSRNDPSLDGWELKNGPVVKMICGEHVQMQFWERRDDYGLIKRKPNDLIYQTHLDQCYRAKGRCYFPDNWPQEKLEAMEKNRSHFEAIAKELIAKMKEADPNQS